MSFSLVSMDTSVHSMRIRQKEEASVAHLKEKGCERRTISDYSYWKLLSNIMAYDRSHNSYIALKWLHLDKPIT